MRKNSLIIIFLVVFVDLVGFGMVIPILPYYAKSFGASATVLGWLMMCYSGMQFIFSPLWGRLSDRIGRRPVILTSILGIGISMVILGFARSLGWLFAGRLLAGFFGANIAAASAYIADVTPPEKRAKGMGLIGAAFGLGFLFGPALGGILSRWGYGTAAFAAAGISLFNFIFASLELKEPELSEEIRKEHRSRFNKKLMGQIISNPKTGIAIFLFFLVTTGFAQLETTFALFLLARFGLDAQHAGLILASMALVMIFVQGGAIGKLVKTLGEAKLVLAGTALMTLALFAASFAHHTSFFVTALLFQALGFAITNPSLSSLTSRNAAKGTQGATLGVYQSAGSLARVVGPVIAGVLFDHYGIQFPFWGASVLFALACLIVMLKKSTWDENSPETNRSQIVIPSNSPQLET
jgi:DHA1 family tetracycline resistance protein-like MFS transporter